MNTAHASHTKTEALSSGMPVLEAINVSAVFGSVAALHGASAQVIEGKVTVICGANGSGKSTFLKCLSGLESPTTGEIRLKGQSIERRHRREIARQIAVLGQNPEAPAGLTVEELVEQGRYPHRRWLARLTAVDKQAIDRAILAVDLDEFRDRQVLSLSGGERQRAWIAMAMAQEPDILFLDEPTTFLDVRHQAELLTLLTRLNKEKGLTIIAILHDLNQVIEFADHVILMKKGSILAQGETGAVMTQELLSDAFACNIHLVAHPLHDQPFCLVKWVDTRDGDRVFLAGTR